MSINNINGLTGQNPARANEGGGKVGTARGDEAKAQGAKAGAAPAGADSVSLTDTAARLRSLESTLAEQPEVDSERVATIQRAIEDGSYEVSAGRIADKLMSFEAAFAK
ncbi:MAG: flagellar biosynthesis anti-sigma factor FlgM [Pseudomonadota bacterium]